MESNNVTILMNTYNCDELNSECRVDNKTLTKSEIPLINLGRGYSSQI